MFQVQQHQTRKYFEKNAKQWDQKAKSDDTRINIIKQRNDQIISILKGEKSISSFLDVGCGTGDLVIQVGDLGIESEGVDFSKNMIDVAKKNKIKKGCSTAHFFCSSIFDHNMKSEGYNLISANGFIEYISLQELHDFFDLVYQHLHKGGIFSFSSRNRLFNIFSLNLYTANEIKNNAVIQLIEESMQYLKGKEIDEIIAQKDCVCPVSESEYKGHSRIDVNQRNQYTPAQLAVILKDKGFKLKSIKPINIHGVPPVFKDKYPEVHKDLSIFLSTFKENSYMFLPYSSTFMMAFIKDS